MSALEWTGGRRTSASALLARLLGVSIANAAPVMAVTALVVGRDGATAESAEVDDGAIDVDRLAAVTVLLSAAQYDAAETGWGSGSIVSQDGLILTNAHVAANRAPGVSVLDPEIRPPRPTIIELTTGSAKAVVVTASSSRSHTLRQTGPAGRSTH